MKRISTIFAALAVLALVSCNKEPVEDITSYYKVYADNTEILGFAEETTQSFTCYVRTTDAGVDKALDILIGVDESLVSQFNAGRSAEEQAKLLPESVYSFTNQLLIRAMYRISDKATFTMKYDDSVLEPETLYVLPIVITDLSGSSDAHIADPCVQFVTVKTAKAGMGKGTADKPYLIRTAEDMLSVSTLAVSVTADDAVATYFKLMNDIDMTGIAWLPINPSGDDHYGKKIDFNGNGKTISNLTSEGKYASLFGVVFGKVYDLNIVGAKISASSKAGVLGAFGATSDNFKHTCEITNVHAKNCYVYGTDNGVGGLIGCLCAGVIDRCSYDGIVTSTKNYCGGIVGYTNKGDDYNGAKISNCITSGQVIEDGTISAGHQRFGGIAGGINGQHQIIEYCISTCEVISGTGTGGIVGMAHYDLSSASACLGHDNTVKCCIAWNPTVYARKIKTNNYSPGAVIGYASVDGNYIDCIRRPDMVFVQNTEMAVTDPSYPINYLVPVDQPNSNASAPLTIGIDCDHSSTHISPYHGKAAAEGETASQVAKRIGWNEAIWDLSGNVPALK